VAKNGGSHHRRAILICSFAALYTPDEMRQLTEDIVHIVVDTGDFDEKQTRVKNYIAGVARIVFARVDEALRRPGVELVRLREEIRLPKLRAYPAPPKGGG
jgi:hypothetical protein